MGAGRDVRDVRVEREGKDSWAELEAERTHSTYERHSASIVDPDPSNTTHPEPTPLHPFPAQPTDVPTYLRGSLDGLGWCKFSGRDHAHLQTIRGFDRAPERVQRGGLNTGARQSEQKDLENDGDHNGLHRTSTDHNGPQRTCFDCGAVPLS